MLTRYEHNPILMPLSKLPWANKKIYNCSVVREKKTYVMVFRAVGEDWISRIGLARSREGISFEVEENPIFYPQETWEQAGVEDPRLTKINDIYFLTYTAYDGKIPKVALALSGDLRSFERLGPVFPKWSRGYWQKNTPGHFGWSKGAAVFPEKINNRYCLIFGDDDLWLAWSDDGIHWYPEDNNPLLTPRRNMTGFDAGYVETGPPPIKTDNGWLVFYHGVQRYEDKPQNQRVYSLGAVLLSANNIRQIISRTDEPLLTPEKDYEIIGFIDILPGLFNTLKTLSPENLLALSRKGRLPRAVFSCGAVLDNETIKVYYSAADTVICLAQGSVHNIFSLV